MAVTLDEHTQYSDSGGKPLVNGTVTIGDNNSSDPANNLKDIFSDSALTIALANPQALNSRGQTENKIFLDGKYSFLLKDEDDVQIELDVSRGSVTATEGAISLFNVSGINTITATASPTILFYVDKQQYTFTAVSTNTGAVTLNIDSIGAKSIKDQGSELAAGRIVANSIVLVAFNSTLDIFELVGGTDLSSPGPIGDTTPNEVNSTNFIGPLGATSENSVKGTTGEFTTSLKLAAGATVTEIETTLSSSATKIPTSSAVNTKINSLPLAATVDQEALKTATGDLSTTSNTAYVTGAGGEFGFIPTWKTTNTTPQQHIGGLVLNTTAVNAFSGNRAMTNSFLQRFTLGRGSFGTITLRSRFVQACPPYDLGDNEIVQAPIHSFIWLLIENSSKKVIGGYHAPDPVWANNGPTCIRPEYLRGEKYMVEERVEYIDKKGKRQAKIIPVEKERNIKPYRKICVFDESRDFQDPLRITRIEQEITMDFKNSDMALIPHPFQGTDIPGTSIVLIDPNDPIVLCAEEMKEAGEVALEKLFFDDYVRFGNEHLAGRKTPSNEVMVVKPTWKSSRN